MVTGMTPLLIVDGYNIIGSWDELSKLKETDLGSSRAQLTAILSAYLPWCWDRIIVVFDGRRFDWEHIDGVEVVFTGERETADTMIERLAAGLSMNHKVEVATSDIAEHRSVSNYGAKVLSAIGLYERLEEERSKYRNRLTDESDQRGVKFDDLIQKKVLDNLKQLWRS